MFFFFAKVLITLKVVSILQYTSVIYFLNNSFKMGKHKKSKSRKKKYVLMQEKMKKIVQMRRDKNVTNQENTLPVENESVNMEYNKLTPVEKLLLSSEIQSTVSELRDFSPSASENLWNNISGITCLSPPPSFQESLSAASRYEPSTSSILTPSPKLNRNISKTYRSIANKSKCLLGVTCQSLSPFKQDNCCINDPSTSTAVTPSPKLNRNINKTYSMQNPNPNNEIYDKEVRLFHNIYQNATFLFSLIVSCINNFF